MSPEVPDKPLEKKPETDKKAPNKAVESKEFQEIREVKRKTNRQIAVEQAKIDISYKKLEDYLATNFGFDKEFYRQKAAKDESVWPTIDLFLYDKNSKATPKQKQDIKIAYEEWWQTESSQIVKHMHDSFSAKEIEILDRSNWSADIAVGATPERPDTLINASVYVDKITKQFKTRLEVG